MSSSGARSWFSFSGPFRSADRLPLSWCTVLLWGGLRGALSMALALPAMRDDRTNERGHDTELRLAMHRDTPEQITSGWRASTVAGDLLREIHRGLLARSTGQLANASVLLVAVIGAVDYLTGYEVSFSIFYLIPVATASWYSGRRLGELICLVAASTWLLVDLTSGHEYTRVAIPIWNAAVRLGFFVIVSDLLFRLRKALELQESLARHDPLTGVMNSATFVQRGDMIGRLAARHAHSMVLAYIDLDHFKNVNDRLGHDVGDRVLKAVAAELVKRLRTWWPAWAATSLPSFSLKPTSLVPAPFFPR